MHLLMYIAYIFTAIKILWLEIGLFDHPYD